MGGDEAVIVAGIGCRLGCPAGDISALLARAAALARVSIDRVAVPAHRRDEAGVLAAVAGLGLPIVVVARADLLAVQARCVTRSARAQAAVGMAAVAEAAALAGAGAAARLVLPRIACATATCALAAVP